MLKFQWLNWQARDDVHEGQDFICVTKELFSYFIDNYGSVEKDPMRKFKREMKLSWNGTLGLKMYLYQVKFVVLPNQTHFKMKEPWFFYMDNSMTIEDFEKKALRAINYYNYSVLKDRSTVFSKCRIWRMFNKERCYFEQIDAAFMSSESTNFEGALLNDEELWNKASMCSLELQDDDLFVIEMPRNDGSFKLRHEMEGVFNTIKYGAEADNPQNRQKLIEQLMKLNQTAEGQAAMRQFADASNAYKRQEFTLSETDIKHLDGYDAFAA